MQRRVSQPPGGGKVCAAGLGSQIYDQTFLWQRRQHLCRQHRRGDGVDHRIKGGSFCDKLCQRHRPQTQLLCHCPLHRAACRHGHPRTQRRQTHRQRPPHRAKAQHQHRRAPQGAAAPLQQNADAALGGGDGVIHSQLRAGKIIHQLHPRRPGDGQRALRHLTAQRQRTGLCRAQQLRQRQISLFQRERQQDAVCLRQLLHAAHRIPCPRQCTPCRRLPGIAAHHRKPLCLSHAVISPFPLCAILCRKMKMREGDNFECAPRCGAPLPSSPAAMPHSPFCHLR